MNNLLNFDRLIAAMRETRDDAELQAVMVDMTHWLGFDQFALGHHVDLASPPGDAIRLTNYHPDWIEQSLEKRFFQHDPVHAFSARLVHPFLWSDLASKFELAECHRLILESAHRYGLKVGITIPVHMPGEYQGTCSFAAKDFDALRPYAFSLAQTAATMAFECARQFIRQRQGLNLKNRPDITPRMQEAMILVGRGKTDREIGSILGISKNTAHEHVENARRYYGHAQRSLMVIRAIFDGVITYSEVFGR